MGKVNPKRRRKMEKKYKMNEKQQVDFSKLPMDVFFDILCRLPLESLSQCRWVSKNWYNLFHHPSLAKMHYTKSLENNTTSVSVLLIDNLKELHLIDHQVFDKFETKAPVYNIQSREFKEVFGYFKQFQMVGSVNGLVCFSPVPLFTSRYFIWNPFTRDHITLPKAPKNSHAISGFGYDPTTDVYKVIRILMSSSNFNAEAEVYTLGSESWRHIPRVPYITSKMCSNILVNGCLHWLTYDDNHNLVIVSFNVATEEFHTIPTPASMKKYKYLGVFGGCLCLIVSDGTQRGCNQMWVMEEYGVQGSWARGLMVNPWEGGYEAMKLRNGKLLLQKKGIKLAYYDPKERHLKDIVMQKYDPKERNLKDEVDIRPSFEQALIHVRSLFSPRNIGCNW